MCRQAGQALPSWPCRDPGPGGCACSMRRPPNGSATSPVPRLHLTGEGAGAARQRTPPPESAGPLPPPTTQNPKKIQRGTPPRGVHGVVCHRRMVGVRVVRSVPIQRHNWDSRYETQNTPVGQGGAPEASAKVVEARPPWPTRARGGGRRQEAFARWERGPPPL